MKRISLLSMPVVRVFGLCAASVFVAAAASAQERQVFKCPGNLYTDSLSAKEAAARGCRTLEGAPITVIQSQPVRARAGGGAATPSAASSGEQRVSNDDQKARDADARRILEAELAKEEAALAQLKREFNNGEPERLGSERNFQRYLDRVEGMRQDIARKEADIAALRRELAKVSGNAAGGGGAAPDAQPSGSRPR